MPSTTARRRKSTEPLFRPARLGRLALPHRIVMAPMTRCRADGAGVPSELVGEYYRQRASAAFIDRCGRDRSRTGRLVAFARAFLANPDLPRRFAERAELNEPGETTFYSGGRSGYVDYPFLGQDS